MISSLAQFSTPLDIHIGRKVKFTNPTCIVENEIHEVRHIQKDYRGELAFNLVAVTENEMGKGYVDSLANQFGKCTSPDTVEFVDELN